MKPMLLIIGAAIIILLIPSVLLSVNNFRMTDREESYIATTTSPATSANITLAQELFDDATYNVSSITSNVTGDAPVAASYTSATRVLNVTGLITDATHLLTITYSIDALTGYLGASIGSSTWPIFLVLGVIGLVVAAVYTAVGRGGD